MAGALALVAVGCDAPIADTGGEELRGGMLSFDRALVDLDAQDYDDDPFFSDFLWSNARDVFQMADSCEGARFDVRRPSGSWASYEVSSSPGVVTSTCQQILRHIVELPANVHSLENLGFSLPDALYDKLDAGYTLEEVELWSTVYSGVDCSSPSSQYERHRVNLDFTLRGPGNQGGYGFQSVVYGNELAGGRLKLALTDCEHYTTNPGYPEPKGPVVGPG